MKVELHLLQNFPPSNLNRDDTGAPKDCEFGGFRRARISSQCLKRSIRRSEAFAEELQGRTGIRTQRVSEEIASVLNQQHGRDLAPATTIARAAISVLVGGINPDGAANVLFYIGRDEVQDLASRINRAWDTLLPLALQANGATSDVKGAKRKVKGKDSGGSENPVKDTVAPIMADYRKARAGSIGTVDIALFGRMLAQVPDLNIDAACQVAHAISTNRLFSDFDYWTAVDDLKSADPTLDRGAANIGTLGFNSSCYYRYAMIDANKLAENLGDDKKLALEGIRAFIKGSIAAIPTGKQNGMAAQCPPEFIFAVVRESGMPWSMVNAFEKPVQPDGKESLFEKSVARLDQHWDALADMYGAEGTHRFVKARKDIGGLQSLADAQVPNVSELVERVARTLTERWLTSDAEVAA